MTDEEFNAVALKYSDSIFRIAFNYCKNRADSDDVVQNVLIKLYNSGKNFESEEHIRNWLIRVAINESKKLLISPFKSIRFRLTSLATNRLLKIGNKVIYLMR